MRLAPGTVRLALLPSLLAVPAVVVSLPLSIALLVATGAVLAFYRDPERTPPPEGVLAPADGRVSVIREEEGRVRVGVFMNVTDVHVNRAPLGGVVDSVDHSPGGHWPAFSKESERNERVRIRFDRPDGDYEAVLVAGTVARRIRPYVSPGARVERGERVGHIAFGSRADVLLPARFEVGNVRVEKGQRVRAGETVVADQ